MFYGSQQNVFPFHSGYFYRLIRLWHDLEVLLTETLIVGPTTPPPANTQQNHAASTAEILMNTEHCYFKYSNISNKPLKEETK